MEHLILQVTPAQRIKDQKDDAKLDLAKPRAARTGGYGANGPRYASVVISV